MNTQPNEWVISYAMNKLKAKYPDITREEIIREWQEMNGIKVAPELNSYKKVI